MNAEGAAGGQEKRVGHEPSKPPGGAEHEGRERRWEGVEAVLMPSFQLRSESQKC